MKLKDILPYLYAESFSVNALRSTLTETVFVMDEKSHMMNLYGEIPVVRISVDYDRTIRIVLY